jgi:hypothetical protein
MSTTHCTNHCTTCGRHFHSLEAFDAHRTGDHREPLGSEAGRRCIAPIECVDGHGEPKLVPLAENGVCRLGDAGAEIGVTVWTQAGYESKIAHLYGSRPERSKLAA